ncbi:MAG TPA: sigma-70 family RNA polymerase sigma factor [Planctomycetota bacterium]|nr:sigma-70 family RNA polymerase sigma factor [Planctomycetota bacterium]
MDRTGRTIKAQHLLAEASWVRRLAQWLVGDPTLAEDLAQDAWVAALERRPDARGERGLRDWLALVVRRRASKVRRREAARQDVERAAARDESVSGGQELVERMQLQRLLAEAVLTLEEPYRSAVILRHLDGLAPEEIARRQGCTNACARQRVARGLAQLRAELDRRSGGDRSAWSAALAAVLDLAPSGAPAAAAATVVGIAGGGIVASKLVALAAGLGIAAGVLIWMQAEVGPDEVAGRSEAPAAAAPDAAPEPAPAGLAAASAPAQPRVDPEGERIEAPLGERSAASELAGRVVDEAARPVGGATVALLAREDPDDGEPLAKAESDAEGRFHIGEGTLVRLAASGSPCALLATRDGFVPAHTEVRSGEPVEIVLVTRPVVSGRLLDPSASPVAPPGRVRLTLFDAGGEERTFEAPVDAEGHWMATDLVPGRLTHVWGRAKGFAPGEQAVEIELAPGARTVVDLTVTPGARAQGVVLDAVTGEPIPRAEVWAESWSYDADSFEPTAVADERGRFQLAGIEPGQMLGAPEDVAWLRITARTEGYVGKPFDFVPARKGSDGTYFVEVKIQPALASLAGRVSWPDGSPAPGVLVQSIDDQRNFHFAVSDPQGRFELERLPAGTLFVLASTRDEAAEESRGAVRAEIKIRPGMRENAELTLQPAKGTSIEGRVTDLSGSPVPGCKIDVGHHFAVPDLTLGLAHLEAVTDAEGRFRLEDRLPGRYELSVSLSSDEGRAVRPAERSLDLSAGATISAIDFVVAPAIRLSGWVEHGPRALAELTVELRSSEDGEVLDRREPAADGSFAFDGLFPARYELVLTEDGNELARASCGRGSSAGINLVAPP